MFGLPIRINNDRDLGVKNPALGIIALAGYLRTIGASVGVYAVLVLVKELREVRAGPLGLPRLRSILGECWNGDRGSS